MVIQIKKISKIRIKKNPEKDKSDEPENIFSDAISRIDKTKSVSDPKTLKMIITPKIIINPIMTPKMIMNLKSIQI